MKGLVVILLMVPMGLVIGTALALLAVPLMAGFTIVLCAVLIFGVPIALVFSDDVKEQLRRQSKDADSAMDS